MPFGPEAFVAATSVVAAAATWRTAVDSRNYLRAQKEKRSELGALQPTQFQRVAEVGKSLVAGPGYVAGPHRPGVNPHVPPGGFREAQRRDKTRTFQPQPKPPKPFGDRHGAGGKGRTDGGDPPLSRSRRR